MCVCLCVFMGTLCPQKGACHGENMEPDRQRAAEQIKSVLYLETHRPHLMLSQTQKALCMCVCVCVCVCVLVICRMSVLLGALYG